MFYRFNLHFSLPASLPFSPLAIPSPCHQCSGFTLVAERPIFHQYLFPIYHGTLHSAPSLPFLCLQRSGFTVVADKLNFHRYLSHFRSVHRGAFFATLRTTTVRKLLPE